MNARYLIVLLAILYLCLALIKEARADDQLECQSYFYTAPNSEIETLPNIPKYSNQAAFNPKAVPTYCACAILVMSNGMTLDIDNTLKCQALSGLFELMPL